MSAKAIWGAFALVSYVPAPLGPFLDQFRQSLLFEDFPRAHITLLPPRPLNFPVEGVSEYARVVLNRFSAFNVRLGDVTMFPETEVLYLNLRAGESEVHELHDALNTGSLRDDEQFEFRPHLTLAKAIDRSGLKGIEQQASESWKGWSGERTFKLTEVTALWTKPGGTDSEWQRVWTHLLPTPHSQKAQAGASG